MTARRCSTLTRSRLCPSRGSARPLKRTSRMQPGGGGVGYRLPPPWTSLSTNPLTLEVVVSVCSAPDRHAGRVNRHLPVAPQPALDLPRAASLLEPQGEQVVMATEADQNPLAYVHPLAGELQRVGAVAQVGPDRQVTL